MPEIKLDQDQIQRLVAYYRDRLAKFDQLGTSILTSHLLIEEFLDEALEAVAKNLKYLGRNPSFDQKVRLVRTFGAMGNDDRWQLVLAINELRNKVAHKFDGPERTEALQKVRDLSVAAGGDPGAGKPPGPLELKLTPELKAIFNDPETQRINQNVLKELEQTNLPPMSDFAALLAASMKAMLFLAIVKIQNKK
jgi:hypothetical protein